MIKLVRDKVPALIMKDGRNPVYTIAEDNDDFAGFLFDKLLEECHEAIVAFRTGEKLDQLEELADVFSIIMEMARLYQITEVEIYDAMDAKYMTHGGFDNRFILSTKESLT